MCGLEILAAKNSSAAKQAAVPARCKMAGKAFDRAEVRGTSTFIEPSRSYNRKTAYAGTVPYLSNDNILYRTMSTSPVPASSGSPSLLTHALGRARSQRQGLLDAPSDSRNGMENRVSCPFTSGTIEVKRPRVRGQEERFAQTIPSGRGAFSRTSVLRNGFAG